MNIYVQMTLNILLCLSMRFWRIYPILSAYIMHIWFLFLFLRRRTLLPCYFPPRILATLNSTYYKRCYAVWCPGKGMIGVRNPGSPVSGYVTMAKSLISFNLSPQLHNGNPTRNTCSAYGTHQVDRKGRTETIVCKCALCAVRDGDCCYSRWKK